MCLVILAGAAGGRRPLSLARAGATAGALAGMLLLIVSMLDGLVTMGSVWRDPVYVAEFLRSGQPSLPAYVLGERIFGAVVVLVMAVVVGIAAGLAAGTVHALINRLRHSPS